MFKKQDLVIVTSYSKQLAGNLILCKPVRESQFNKYSKLQVRSSVVLISDDLSDN